jgi:hypothetical protein
MRKVTPDDFKGIGSYVKALYLGKSKFLRYGEWYNIMYMKKRNKVSVPWNLNQKTLERSNQGIEFSINTFYVKEE